MESRILNAGEALAKSLVTRVCPTARWHKQLAKKTLRPETLSKEDWREPLASCDTADYREGIRAFLAKEKTVFRGE